MRCRDSAVHSSKCPTRGVGQLCSVTLNSCACIVDFSTWEALHRPWCDSNQLQSWFLYSGHLTHLTRLSPAPKRPEGFQKLTLCCSHTPPHRSAGAALHAAIRRARASKSAPSRRPSEQLCANLGQSPTATVASLAGWTQWSS